jgi:hypothetical protein
MTLSGDNLDAMFAKDLIVGANDIIRRHLNAMLAFLALKQVY